MSRTMKLDEGDMKHLPSETQIRRSARRRNPNIKYFDFDVTTDDEETKEKLDSCVKQPDSKRKKYNNETQFPDESEGRGNLVEKINNTDIIRIVDFVARTEYNKSPIKPTPIIPFLKPNVVKTNEFSDKIILTQPEEISSSSKISPLKKQPKIIKYNLNSKYFDEEVNKRKSVSSDNVEGIEQANVLVPSDIAPNDSENMTKDDLKDWILLKKLKDRLLKEKYGEKCTKTSTNNASMETSPRPLKIDKGLVKQETKMKKTVKGKDQSIANYFTKKKKLSNVNVEKVKQVGPKEIKTSSLQQVSKKKGSVMHRTVRIINTANTDKENLISSDKLLFKVPKLKDVDTVRMEKVMTIPPERLYGKIKPNFNDHSHLTKKNECCSGNAKRSIDCVEAELTIKTSKLGMITAAKTDCILDSNANVLRCVKEQVETPNIEKSKPNKRTVQKRDATSSLSKMSDIKRPKQYIWDESGNVKKPVKEKFLQFGGDNPKINVPHSDENIGGRTLQNMPNNKLTTLAKHKDIRPSVKRKKLVKDGKVTNPKEQIVPQTNIGSLMKRCEMFGKSIPGDLVEDLTKSITNSINKIDNAKYERTEIDKSFFHGMFPETETENKEMILLRGEIPTTKTGQSNLMDKMSNLMDKMSNLMDMMSNQMDMMSNLMDMMSQIPQLLRSMDSTP